MRERSVARNARLRRLGFEDYSDYISSETWKSIRYRYFASGCSWECPCGVTEHLQLHHLTYDRVGGEELLDDLQPLCGDCHRDAHVLERRGDIGLELTGLYNLEQGRANHAERIRQRALAARAQEEPLREVAHDLERTSAELAEYLTADPRPGAEQHAKGLHRECKVLLRKLYQDLVDAYRTVGAEPEPEDLEALARYQRSGANDGSEDSAALKCDGSMTCTCTKCAAGLASRKAHGVARRNPVPIKQR